MYVCMYVCMYAKVPATQACLHRNDGGEPRCESCHRSMCNLAARAGMPHVYNTCPSAYLKRMSTRVPTTYFHPHVYKPCHRSIRHHAPRADVDVSIQTYVRVSIRISIYSSTCVRTCLHTCLHPCLHTGLYTRLHTSTHVYTRLHTFYTRLNTWMFSLVSKVVGCSGLRTHLMISMSGG